MTDLLLITTTSSNRERLESMARELVQEGLAACVQIGGPLHSWFRWKGQLEEAHEWILTAKTSADCWLRAEPFLRSRHDYDLPEIIATRIDQVSPAYRKWLLSEIGAGDP